MTLDELAELMNKNHLDVSQRLTAIETTITNSHTAYGDIPDRVLSLESNVSWLKGAGAIVGMLWAALLALINIRFHR